MRILLRTFNDGINSKTGVPLPDMAKRRGTPDWHEFELNLVDVLRKYAEVILQPESPIVPDVLEEFDRYGYVHKTKRDCPNGSLFWMQMHLPNLFTLDHLGWGVDCSKYGIKDFMEGPKDAVEKIEQLSDKMWSENISKIEQPKVVSCDIDAPFILVPLQIPRDYTIQWHSPITVKYFLDSIQAWAHLAQTHVAFKLHPCNRIDTDLISAVHQAQNQSRYCHLVDGNIHELIKRSSGLFVINSGTGFEALIHGKPVCTFGACDYNRVTFNADIRRIDEARNFIFDFDEKKRDIVRRFVYWYMNEYAIDIRSNRMTEKIEEYVKTWIKS